MKTMFIPFSLVHVQSNQKMHDLYATMHIFQMALPDAFWAKPFEKYALYHKGRAFFGLTVHSLCI